MKLIIDIPEEVHKRTKFYKEFHDLNDCVITIKALENGIPLPKGHGRLIDKDHMIARLEAASKFYGGENTDAFDERFSYGLKEAAIKVAEEPTIIEADTESEPQESEDEG